ncbi:GNAT family N-acetyltransferase [Microlunatus sp. GCM10028923]|uniref:GNAT family N-acetyltransferase n=1 Tax=Microlunatus sp. GCM10028923 TaxID=3273400 RepID=UPI00360D6FAB
MSTVNVRPMTDDEYPQWLQALSERFAREQVEAGTWAPEGAFEAALAKNQKFLPQGRATPGMLILVATDGAGSPVGRAWVGLDHPAGKADCAFLYDIEIEPAQRGRGFGRALLEAVEQATREAGAPALELNVFAPNRTAVALYGSAGYAVTTQQMRKDLPG